MYSIISVNLREFENEKRYNILYTAKWLFWTKGYPKTTIRQIVKEADTSTENFYFHNKISVLKIIAMGFITILRNQIGKVKNV